MNANQITPELFAFFRELERNNNKQWFQSNKERYEQQVRLPLQRMIMDFEQPLRRISPHYRADPRPVITGCGTVPAVSQENPALPSGSWRAGSRAPGGRRMPRSSLR